MAGFIGNVGWIMAQKQSAKGTAATVALPGVAAGAWKNSLVGGGLGPTRTLGQLNETDASRDQGVSFVQNESAGGSPEFYARDDSLGFWLWAALGADAVTGTTNFVHTITPSNTLPYLTTWRDVSDQLFEQFLDCKVNSLAIATSAGQPLTATANIMGIKGTRLTSDPSTSAVIPISSAYVYNYNNATVTVSGGATALVDSFSLSIDNGVSSQQTDDVVLYDVVEGKRAVTLDFDLIFSSLNEYNAFHYGSTSGTVVSPTIYTTSADFQFDNGANNQIKFTLPSIAYTEFPVDLDPGGNPIKVAVKAVAQRSGSPIVTATIKNQVAVY